MTSLLLVISGLVSTRVDSRVGWLPTATSAGLPWTYISKFGFKIGNDATVRGEISGLLPTPKSGTYSLAEISSPELLLYCDDEWPGAIDFDARVSAVVSMHDHCEKRAALARERVKLNISADGVASFESKLTHVMRPHVWFVVFADCARARPSAEEALWGPFEIKIEYLQPDGSHLPCDESGLPSLYLICTAAVVAFSGYFWQKLLRHHSATGEIHPVTASLGIVLALQLCSLVLEQIHLWVLEGNGEGVKIFDGMSHVASVLSTGIFTALLVLIGTGPVGSVVMPSRVVMFAVMLLTYKNHGCRPI